MNIELREKYIKLLHDICMIETPSGSKENINVLVDTIECFSKKTVIPLNGLNLKPQEIFCL